MNFRKSVAHWVDIAFGMNPDSCPPHVVCDLICGGLVVLRAATEVLMVQPRDEWRNTRRQNVEETARLKTSLSYIYPILCKYEYFILRKNLPSSARAYISSFAYYITSLVFRGGIGRRRKKRGTDADRSARQQHTI